ncbi:MAG: 2-dehydropantoate 2-reductase [Colwellia sp.]|jgi:2-dehydropantoate 2-reductase|nr:MAG: 2-dehydropantoate 2-reductase [Colwellia sp.]
MLKIAIIGAGGIGCYYGARLQSANHKVVYIARGEHLDALTSSGLTLTHPDFTFKDNVTACSLSTFFEQYEPNDFDIYLLCVKANITEEIAKELQPWLKRFQQTITIISLQNGVDNEAILKKHLPDSFVVGGLAVRIGGHISEPGIVQAKGVAQLIIGKWPHANEKSNSQLTAWSLIFQKAKIPTQIVSNIRFELWRKLLINNGVNPLSALTGLDTKKLTHHPRFGKIVYQLMKEVAQVSCVEHEVISTKDVDEMYKLIRTFEPIKTSMLVDYEKGRALELDEICGAVLKRSQIINVSVPYTEVVYALLEHELKKRVI